MRGNARREAYRGAAIRIVLGRDSSEDDLKATG
jgi:hypothetical protein